MVIDVKPATTLAEAADQMEEAMGMCVDHYVPVCDVVLSNWAMICRSVDVNALMALADEIDLLADENQAGDTDEYWIGVGQKDAAERIREVLVVEDA